MNNLAYSFIVMIITITMILSQTVSADQNYNIPSWIKNNAKWWSAGQIRDDDFVKGIQYMVEQGIMKIPLSPGGYLQNPNQIPQWIKNNAKWWAAGQIDDSAFVKGMQYLVQVGIIQVSIVQQVNHTENTSSQQTNQTNTSQPSTTIPFGSTQNNSSYNVFGGQNNKSYLPINVGECGANNTYFYVPPISFSNFSSITPLGWVSAGGHVLPSDHIYFNLNQVGPGSPFNGTPVSTSVVAPGNFTIYEISGRSYSSNGRATGNDYSIYFAPCNDISAYIHHVRMLSNKLLSNFTPSGQTCENGTINAGQIHSCNKIVNIKVKTGELLGYTGGVPLSQGGVYSLDLGVYDTRSPSLIYANSSRYFSHQFHVVCPINYYPQNMQNILLAKMGMGSITRTQPPLCGQNDYDMLGTAQGNWFRANTPTPYINEGPLISLARSNLIPSVGLFSVGSSSNIPGLSGVTYYFNPASTGLVNSNFSNVTANGNIYCYSSLSDTWMVNQPARGIILLQLVNSNTLRIEYQNAGSCGSGPWSFTPNHADFYR